MCADECVLCAASQVQDAHLSHGTGVREDLRHGGRTREKESESEAAERVYG